MTSILDQYNNTMKRCNVLSQLPCCTSSPSSGYVTVRTKEEQPIFTKQKMKLNLEDDITHMVVSNNWLICLMSHKILLRLFLPKPDKPDEVLLEKYTTGFYVTRLFLDPSGNHLLIALSSKSSGQSFELFYLHSKSNKPKKLDKFKDYEITAIGFNYNNYLENSTGPILVGTSKGLIFETEFGVDNKFQNNWKQVFDIGRELLHPITCIEFFRVPNTSRYIVFAATIDRLYKFQETLKTDEKLVLQNIFSTYLNIPEQFENYEEVENNNLKYSRLSFNYDISRKYPTQLAWLTESGILYGNIDQNAENPEPILNKQEIKFPLDGAMGNKKKLPEQIVLTEFHALLLYPDHITAICLLNQEINYEEYFNDQYGKFLDIVKDVITGTIYTYTWKFIFRYKITSEQRNVWKIYLDMNEFELAEKYSKENPGYLDIVLCKKAEMYFTEKKYIESSRTYSQTQTNFEKVCLKFLELKDRTPLIIYIESRLNKLQERDKTQITMLVVWLVELYLSALARYEKDAVSKKELQNDFNNFVLLPRVDECIKANRSVIYDLMASHGDTDNLNILTTINKNYELVINQCINQYNYTSVLFVLSKQNKPELYYKYSPILMEEMSQETVQCLIIQEKRLQPIKLLPTLMCLNSNEHVLKVVKYLEFLVYKMCVTNSAIHNFLIKLYGGKHMHDKLEMYLESEGRDITLIHYDINFALRVCEEHQIQTSCVFLQCLLELWYSAVELALDFDSEMAQKTASHPNDIELKRKLWLELAKHDIKRKNDVRKALTLLKDCDLLHIEDLLPFFSDFEKIDDFKETICDSLKGYSMKIQEQQRDMEESAKSAERVRNELQKFRNFSIRIGSQEVCAICEVCLLLKPFFIFQCGHKFHSTCLEKQIIPLLNSYQNRKLRSLKYQLENFDVQHVVNEHLIRSQQNILTRAQIKEEIENILASDCFYCETLIEFINRPFIEDWDQVNVDWQ